MFLNCTFCFSPSQSNGNKILENLLMCLCVILQLNLLFPLFHESRFLKFLGSYDNRNHKILKTEKQEYWQTAMPSLFTCWPIACLDHPQNLVSIVSLSFILPLNLHVYNSNYQQLRAFAFLVIFTHLPSLCMFSH
jgi:hypothetical protein